MDDLVRVDVDQWNGGYPNQPSSPVVSQNREFYFHRAFPAYSVDAGGSQPGPLMSLRNSA
jgi:hypothetical protein